MNDPKKPSVVPCPSVDFAVAEESERVVCVAGHAQQGVERLRTGEDASLEQRAHEDVQIRGR
jgi:hypothetical protein